MKIQVDKTIHLDFLEESDADELLNLVNANRDYLKKWLIWVDHMQNVENFQQHINLTKQKASLGSDFGYAIFFNENITGRIGIYNINRQHMIGEIGYWLAEAMQGKGIIAKCCKTLIDHGFNELGLNRIELKCGLENTKSRAIPEKLGFTREGILRKAELLNGQFIDLYLFSMLKEEWERKVD
jgi:ribosomal-protein-serine acetyltransferase